MKKQKGNPSDSPCCTEEGGGDVRPALKKKRFFRITAIVISVFAAVVLLAMMAISLILTPSRLTPLINKYSNIYLNASVNFDTVSVSVFKSFPFVGIEMSNGEIVSRVFDTLPDSLREMLPVRADSLVSFKKISVSVAIPPLICV